MSGTPVKAAGSQHASPTTSRFFGGGAEQAAAPFFSSPVARVQRKCAGCEADAERQVQLKLTVGEPNDRFEQEADRVADRVMNMPEQAPAAPEDEDQERMPDLGAPVSLQRQTGPQEGQEPEQPMMRPLSIARLPRVQRQAESTAGDEPEEEDQIRAKADGPTGVTSDTEVLVRGLRGGGEPLPPSTLSFFERRMGYDFKDVRVHADSQGAEASRAVHARAFTLGRDVAFVAGQYAPQSHTGRHLLAHELTHVVQQGGAKASSQTAMPVARKTDRARAQRDAIDKEQESLQFLQPDWTQINELGIVYKPGPRNEDGGANLRHYPTGPVITWLEQNTKVYILKEHAKQGWYAVTTLGKNSGEFGYIAKSHLWRYLPDPEADALKLKAGDTPLDVARAHYSRKGFNVWGKDPRYVVNALVWVNNHARHNTPHEAGIKKPGILSDPWFTAETTEGVYIWLPGPDHLNALYEVVAEHGGGTGSITADIWRGIKKALEYVAYGVAFVGGLIHGFFKSLYDAVAGLVELVGGLLKSIFTGSVLKDAKELWEAVSKLTWDDIKAAVGDWATKWDRKLNSGSPWVAGHAHGYLTGYVMAEAAQLLISAGTLAALKGALWTSRLGKAIKATRAFQVMAKGIEEVGTTGAKAKKLMGKAATAVRLSKPFKALSVAQDWVRRALQLSAETVKDLTLDGINLLRTLSDDALDSLRRLAQPLKRTVLGCASPCKVRLDVIKDFLASMSGKVAKGATKLTTIDEVLAALPAGLNKSLIKQKLKRHKALMEAITKSGLTDADLAVISKFLTPADASNAATAYRTFTRTLAALVPAKVGPDITKFNQIADALVAAQVRLGSALKGSMFESFVKLSIHPFRKTSFTRATFSKRTHKLLKKTRTSDAFIDSAGALWDFKHTVGKVPADQSLDYLNIMARGLKSTEGKVVKSVNYLFPTKEVAELNADLVKRGFGVYYVTPPNVRTKLK